MDTNQTIASWNELLAAYKRGEASVEEIRIFLTEMEVMSRSAYQDAAKADNEWRLMTIEWSKRQTAVLERIAAALEALAGGGVEL